MTKLQAKAKQHPEAKLLLFENYSLSSCTLSTKNNKRYSKKCTKNKYVCLNELIWLITMKIEAENEKKLHRYDINRPRPRHAHKYTKYKMCLGIMMVICIKQHLSNTWSSIHEKVKQHWGWVEKKRCLWKEKAKKRCSIWINGAWHKRTYAIVSTNITTFIM